MRQGRPTRGLETDRDCPECNSEDVQRTGETVRQRDARVLEEHFHCNHCHHDWAVELDEEVYRDE